MQVAKDRLLDVMMLIEMAEQFNNQSVVLVGTNERSIEVESLLWMIHELVFSALHNRQCANDSQVMGLLADIYAEECISNASR